MNFEDNCLIEVSNLKIQIVVSNSSLAGALKENLESLKHQLKTKKDISIRIGRI
jgi:hypothetical protein